MSTSIVDGPNAPRWYQYISKTPKWFYKESETFHCGKGKYFTQIELTNDYAGADITSIKFVCSDGSSKEFSNGGFNGPKVYTYTVPTGISSLTIGEGENQVGLIIPSLNLTGNYPKVETFSCPTGSFIDSVAVKDPYANSNFTGRLDYIGGFKFGCTSTPTSSPPPTSSNKSSQQQSKSTTSTSSKSSYTAVIVVVVLLLILLIAGAIGGYYYYKHKKAEKAKKAQL